MSENEIILFVFRWVATVTTQPRHDRK